MRHPSSGVDTSSRWTKSRPSNVLDARPLVVDPIVVDRRATVVCATEVLVVAAVDADVAIEAEEEGAEEEEEE